jgi:hypothetical protein
MFLPIAIHLQALKVLGTRKFPGPHEEFCRDVEWLRHREGFIAGEAVLYSPRHLPGSLGSVSGCMSDLVNAHER